MLELVLEVIELLAHRQRRDAEHFLHVLAARLSRWRTMAIGGTSHTIGENTTRMPASR